VVLDDPKLDVVFAALANEHRREIVRAVGLQPCSISQLAQFRGLSLPAMNKHVGILEAAGLVARQKVGRTSFLTLRRESLSVLQDWLAQYHTYWGSDKPALTNYKEQL
jgi:DNA-binding transcriptional ArsR family regulator